MPRMSNPTLLMQPEHPALSVRAHTTIQALPGLVGESYRRVTAYLEEAGAMMTDMPFVAYHNEDEDALDVEIGFPIDRTLPGSGDLVCRQVPARRVACCMYRGAYHRMNRAIGELRQFIREQGCEPDNSIYEFFYNGLELPQEELLTRIAIPLQQGDTPAPRQDAGALFSPRSPAQKTARPVSRSRRMLCVSVFVRVPITLTHSRAAR